MKRPVPSCQDSCFSVKLGLTSLHGFVMRPSGELGIEFSFVDLYDFGHFVRVTWGLLICFY